MTRHPCGRVTYTEEEIEEVIVPLIMKNLRVSFELEGHKISDSSWEQIQKFAANIDNTAPIG